MKKITYLIKDLEKIFKFVLKNSKNFDNQLELYKKKDILIKDIEKIYKKYEKISKELSEE